MKKKENYPAGDCAGPAVFVSSAIRKGAALAEEGQPFSRQSLWVEKLSGQELGFNL